MFHPEDFTDEKWTLSLRFHSGQAPTTTSNIAWGGGVRRKIEVI